MDPEETKPPTFGRLELFGVAAAGMTLLGVIAGQELQQYAALSVQSDVASAKLQPRFNAIDYGATASLKGGAVVIGPCDTHDR